MSAWSQLQHETETVHVRAAAGCVCRLLPSEQNNAEPHALLKVPHRIISGLCRLALSHNQRMSTLFGQSIGLLRWTLKLARYGRRHWLASLNKKCWIKFLNAPRWPAAAARQGPKF
jgi:hypothetical protein